MTMFRMSFRAAVEQMIDGRVARRIMPGNSGASDPLHRGPYAVVFSGKGKPIRIPLAGNPAL